MNNNVDTSAEKSSRASSKHAGPAMKISVEGAGVYDDKARRNRDRDFGFVNDSTEAVPPQASSRNHAPSVTAESLHIEGPSTSASSPAEVPSRGFVGRASDYLRGMRGNKEKPAVDKQRTSSEHEYASANDDRDISTGHFARTALHDADRTFAQYAMTHANTVLFGLLGLILALLFMYVGFWDTILIAVFVFIGVVIGQAIDGDNGIVNFFRDMFDEIFKH